MDTYLRRTASLMYYTLVFRTANVNIIFSFRQFRKKLAQVPGVTEKEMVLV